MITGVKELEGEMKEMLIKNGFKLLEASTMIYGNGIITGSICRIDDKSKKARFKVNTDDNYDKCEEVFCPYQGDVPENDRIVIRNETELTHFLIDKTNNF